LLATYGVSAQATLSVTAGGINVSGTVNIGPLDYGIFHLASTSNGPITVTFSNTGLQVPSGAELTFNSLSASSLALAAFVINNDGSFIISAAGTLVWDGRSLGFLVASLVRTPAGVTTLTANVNLSPISIGNYSVLRPKTGTTIAATLQAASTGTFTYSMSPARLDLAGVGSTVQLEIYGANTNAPFTFSTTGPWNATVAATRVTIDPPGAVPVLFQAAAYRGVGNLFSAALNGNGTTSVTFTGTRTGTIEGTLFPGSAMERDYPIINPGTMTFTLGVGVFDLAFDPPDLAYGNAFRLESGSIEIHATTTNGSVNLVAPTLRLLPGNYLERSLSLTSAALSPSSFVLDLNGETLNFPQLPSLTLTGNMTLTSTGFSMSSFSSGGRGYGSQPLVGGGSTPALVSFGSSASGNSLAFDGTTLSLVANNPSATILGLSLATSDLAAVTFSVGLSGAFDAAFEVYNDENLYGSGIVKLRSGNVHLAGTISALDGNFTLNAGARVVLVHPNPANLSATVSHTNNFTLNVAQGEDFTATLTSSLPTFDLGWLRVDPGGAGGISFTRDATTGAMGLSFDGWDIYLFGVKFDNTGFSFNTSGLLSRSVGTANFDFGSGIHLLRIATSATTPVSWNGLTGAIAVNLPTSAELQTPNLPAITGTLLNGIDLPSGFPTLTARGTFTNTWSHSFTINNLNFGTQSVRLWRQTTNGNLRVEVTGSNALGLTGLSHRTYVSTAGNFESELTQQFNIGTSPTYHLATVNLSLNTGDPIYQFQGTADITNLSNNAFTPDASLKIGSGGVAFFGLNFPLP
jgi:hypothetical protein